MTTFDADNVVRTTKRWDELREQLAMIEGGQLCTRTGPDDDTAATVARIKAEIEECDRILAKYWGPTAGTVQ
jgi:hypothetical protein